MGDTHSLPSPISEGGQGGAITRTGIWHQGLMKETVTFRPADTLFQLRRSQTPQPPYRFDEETVAVDYVDSHGNTVHLEGTLTIPRQPSPPAGRGARQGGVGLDETLYPTLLLVSGSGQQNRDEELFQHKPFLVLADCRELPGLNHLFQHCTIGLPSEYMMTEETFAPEAMKALTDWILALP